MRRCTAASGSAAIGSRSGAAVTAEASRASRAVAGAASPQGGQTAGMTADLTGPAALDPGEYFGDWGAELERCARQHWWAHGMDQHGTPTAVVLSWEGCRAALTDRRLSPR